MWDKYIQTANETITPRTFRASEGAINQHNNEIFGVESKINVLTLENDELKAEVQKYDIKADTLGYDKEKLETENDKLRKALEEIEKAYIDGCMPAWAMYIIAKTALEDKA